MPKAIPGSPTAPTPTTGATTAPDAGRHGTPGAEPLIEAGLDKQDVRQIARELDIPVWDKPAQPCLSSRVPYGTPVTAETLSKIEQAEDYLRGLGLRGVRARHQDRLCRIEVDESELDVAFRRRNEIVAQLKKNRLPLGVPRSCRPSLGQP